MFCEFHHNGSNGLVPDMINLTEEPIAVIDDDEVDDGEEDDKYKKVVDDLIRIFQGYYDEYY